jgi:hypothetical protein
MKAVSQEPNPSTEELPEELRPAARALTKALSENHGVSHFFADFCAKAYVKPEWAGAASEFLATAFEDREQELAGMARIPDLIIELASGQQTLTTVVAFQWAAHSDSGRLTKLAEALAATQSKIQSAEVVHLMLALATSLAITRYPRAMQMLTLSEPQATDEHSESLAEARQWLAIGGILRGCSQETRDLWDHRLRRRRTMWTWTSPAECVALEELADHLKPDQEGAEIFKSIVPPAWWETAQKLVAERAVSDAEPTEPERIEAEPIFPRVTPSATSASPDMAGSGTTSLFPPEESPVIIWNAWPFFAGGLVGAAALAMVIWISPYELKKARLTDSAEGEYRAATPAVNAPPPPQDEWRKSEAARVAAESTDLQDLHGRILTSSWADVEGLLSGSTADLPKEDTRYPRLLTWLHLDPPKDAEIRKRLPALLATVKADSDTLDLWDKLAYKGSLMEEAIRNGARRQIYENQDAWTASQEHVLGRIGFPTAP